MAEPRRTFAPVVLVGLASGALSAVAGTKAWLASEVAADQVGGKTLADQIGLDVDAPLAAALSLVLLAAWGVILVTRGRVRRWVGLLATASAVGLLVVTVRARWTMPDELRNRFEQNDLTASLEGSHFTSWWYAALAAAVISVLATLGAVRFAPHWPEMGSRYDAPGGGASGPVDPEQASSTELWKAIDEGQDPTSPDQD